MQQKISKYAITPIFASLTIFSGSCTGTCGSCTGACISGIVLAGTIYGNYCLERNKHSNKNSNTFGERLK